MKLLTPDQRRHIEASARNTTDSASKIAHRLGLPTARVAEIVNDIRAMAK